MLLNVCVFFFSNEILFFYFTYSWPVYFLFGSQIKKVTGHFGWYLFWLIAIPEATNLPSFHNLDKLFTKYGNIAHGLHDGLYFAYGCGIQYLTSLR